MTSLYLNAPRFRLLDALLCVTIAFLGAWLWFCMGEIRLLRDELSRKPQGSFLSIPGAYPSVTVYREGWSVREPDRGVGETMVKPNNKKGAGK